MRHLRQQNPSGFDGLVVRLLDSITLESATLNCVVSVCMVQCRPMSTHSNPDLSIYQVPLIMLVPPHMWPIGYSQSVTGRTLLYGLPYSDRALGLQVGERYTLAPSARLSHLTIRANMPYCAGDYFSLPVLATQGSIKVVDIVFLCVLQDTHTKNWLVSLFCLNCDIDFCITLVMSQTVWCPFPTTRNHPYFACTVLTTFTTMSNLSLPVLGLRVASSMSSLKSSELPQHLRTILKLTTPVCRRSLFFDLSFARQECLKLL